MSGNVEWALGQLKKAKLVRIADWDKNCYIGPSSLRGRVARYIHGKEYQIFSYDEFLLKYSGSLEFIFHKDTHGFVWAIQQYLQGIDVKRNAWKNNGHTLHRVFNNEDIHPSFIMTETDVHAMDWETVK